MTKKNAPAANTARQDFDSIQSISYDIHRSCLPAGIIAGEVLVGAFLLMLAGVLHRRYRWKSERSWVLFDWDVVADKDKSPPRINFNFVHRFGHGNKHVSPISSTLLPPMSFQFSDKIRAMKPKSWRLIVFWVHASL